MKYVQKVLISNVSVWLSIIKSTIQRTDKCVCYSNGGFDHLNTWQVCYPHRFLTAYKRLRRLCALAGKSDSKNPDLYYLYNVVRSISKGSPRIWANLQLNIWSYTYKYLKTKLLGAWMVFCWKKLAFMVICWKNWLLNLWISFWILMIRNFKQIS